MKFISLALAILCAVAYAAAQVESESQQEAYVPARFRRATDPQGSVSVQAVKPMSGPDRRPFIDAQYNHRFYDKNGVNANAFGGLTKYPGQPAQTRGGVNVERNFRNGAFVRGFGQVQRAPSGRHEPAFGLSTGFRFRRDADFEEQEQQYY